MKIKDILASGQRTLSFEVFPPKPGAPFEPIRDAVTALCAEKPSFMSVTYGAGGLGNTNTLSIAKHVESLGTTALAHLTCLTATREKIQEELAALRAAGIGNILALRGDRPADGSAPSPLCYAHASDLVGVIKEVGGFCVGGACYPECHPECDHIETDIDNLKRKVDAGVDFLTTQMFFDNIVFYQYLARLRTAGITVPVIAGIMPVTNGKQVTRICALSGRQLPPRFKSIVDTFGENPREMMDAGIAYATEQIIDLFANGVKAVHLYTMNKPEVGRRIVANLGSILR